jgi:hypothetical protein
MLAVLLLRPKTRTGAFTHKETVWLYKTLFYKHISKVLLLIRNGLLFGALRPTVISMKVGNTFKFHSPTPYSPFPNSLKKVNAGALFPHSPRLEAKA